MSLDLIRAPQFRLVLLCVSLILFALAFTGCTQPDVKADETRILAEINQLAEQSSKQIRSDELMGPLRRLNELKPSFPARRDEIAKEARAAKTAFVTVLKDDEKLADLYQQLLRLPLADSYRKCITAQAEIEKLISGKSQRVIDEMDILLDPSVNDRETLDARVELLRKDDDKTGKRLSELEMYLDQNCRRPSSNRQEQ